VKNIDKKEWYTMMRIIMVFLSFILLTGCTAVETNQPNGDSQDEKNSTAIQLETKLEAIQKDEKVVFNLTLSNVGSEDAELTFSSGQQFEIVVKNEDNKEVYRYSEGRMFTQALITEQIKAGEQLEWKIEWDQKTNSNLVANGEYTVSAEVLANPTDESVTIDGVQLQQTISIVIENSNTSQGEENEETGSNGTDTEDLENKAFRNIKVEGESGEYTVTGEARVFEGVFGYSVSDGHKYYIEEETKKVEQGAPNWSPFTIEISIPKDKLPVNGTIMLELYVESAKDGSKVDQLYVPLEKINK
jgi:hypothetical protein